MGNALFGTIKEPASPQERQRRRLEERYGVLVPPTFVAAGGGEYGEYGDYGAGAPVWLPVSTRAYLQRTSSSSSSSSSCAASAYTSSSGGGGTGGPPNIVDQLWNTNTGWAVLHEYMHPGLYLAVPTNRPGGGGGRGGSSEGQILVALEASAAASTAAPPVGPAASAVGVDAAAGTTTSFVSALSTPSSSSPGLTRPTPPPPPPAGLPPTSPPPPPPSLCCPSTFSFLSVSQSFPSWFGDVRLMVPTSPDVQPSLRVTSTRGGGCSGSSSSTWFPGSRKTTVSALLDASAFSSTAQSTGGIHSGGRIRGIDSIRGSSSNGIRGIGDDIGATAVSASGGGWVGATVHLPAVAGVAGGGIGCTVGSYMTVESMRNLVASSSSSSPLLSRWGEAASTTTGGGRRPGPGRSRSSRNNHRNNHRYAPSTVHLQAAAEHGESVLAAHAEVPLLTPNTGGPFVPERTDALLWLNLNGGGGQDGVATTATPTTTTAAIPAPPPPPLWLTMRRSCTRGAAAPTYTVNLAQVVTFDRPVWNLLEDRAPSVRNHLGWAVQMERDAEAGTSRWKAGASVQLNRNVAAKAVLEEDGCRNSRPFLRYALVVRRWGQPRMTLSVVNGVDLTTDRRHSLVGFGLELEPAVVASASTAATPWTGPDAADNGTDRAKYQESANVERSRAPPTKILINHPRSQLPSETRQKKNGLRRHDLLVEASTPSNIIYGI